MYAVENKNYEPGAWRIHRVFLSHESCPFMEMVGYNVILP